MNSVDMFLEKSRRVALLVVLSLIGVPAAASAETVERLSIVANGAVIGTIAANIEGSRATVDYAVSNNGRGPRHQERIELGEHGIPVSWIVEGSSVMGAPVTEKFSWSNSRARWSAEPDQGDVEAPKPKLYAPNEDSPWALGVYAQALLQAPGNRLEILPGGVMSLAKAREATIGSGASAQQVVIHRLEGYQLHPDYVALDREGRLFAALKQSAGGMPALLAIRTGYEKEAGDLRRLFADLEDERALSLQRKLAHKFDRPVRIVNVRVFDPDAGTVTSPTTVVVDGEKITRVVALEGDRQPASDVVVIDGAGGTLIPGLADMHAHTSLQSGLLHIAAGVTTARDMGNDNGVLSRLISRIESGEITGPHMVRNGFIEGKSPFSANNGKVVDSLEAAIAAVRWYSERNYLQIKIYNSINPAWIKPLTEEAHRLGLGVSGHVPAFARPDDVITAGFDEVTHINQLMLGWLLKDGEDSRTTLRLLAMARAADLDLSSEKVRRTVRLMKDRGTWIDPTVSIFEWLMLSRAGAMPPTDTAFFEHMPMGFQRAEKRTYVKLESPQDDARFKAGFKRMLDTLNLLHRNGIKFLPGTDMANGFNLHRELVLYVQAGLTPAEAMKAATIDVARYLRKGDQSGSIARGKVADMVLLAEDPTKNIGAVAAPRMVMKAGTIYFPSEIYREVGIRPFSEAPLILRAD